MISRTDIQDLCELRWHSGRKGEGVSCFGRLRGFYCISAND